jgi:hypothetical protein
MPYYRPARPEDYPEREHPRRPWEEWGPQEQERNLRQALGLDIVGEFDADSGEPAE